MYAAARIKKIKHARVGASTKTTTKFKVRCSRYLYTLVVDDPDKAEKLRQSLPPGTFLIHPKAAPLWARSTSARPTWRTWYVE